MGSIELVPDLPSTSKHRTHLITEQKTATQHGMCSMKVDVLGLAEFSGIFRFLEPCDVHKRLDMKNILPGHPNAIPTQRCPLATVVHGSS